MSFATSINIRGVNYFFWVRPNPIAPLDPAALPIVATPESFTIASIRHTIASVGDAATYDFTLFHGASVVAGGTEIITGGMTSDNTQTVETVFNSALIAVDDVIWITASALANGPGLFHSVQIVIE